MEGTLEEVLDSKFHIAMRWIRLLQHGFTISDYLEKQGVKSIIVYGITDFTLSILEEYKVANKLTKIKAISDKKIVAGEVTDYDSVQCVSLDKLSNYASNDTIVIITPLGWYKEIKNDLINQGLNNVMTIQELIYDMCSAMNDNGEKV